MYYEIKSSNAYQQIMMSGAICCVSIFFQERIQVDVEGFKMQNML